MLSPGKVIHKEPVLDAESPRLMIVIGKNRPLRFFTQQLSHPQHPSCKVVCVSNVGSKLQLQELRNAVGYDFPMP